MPRRSGPPLGVVIAFLIAVIAATAFIAIEIAVLHAGYRDNDEGIYWQSLRALARGEALYRDIWASSPPAFYYALLPFYLAGHSIAVLRFGIVLFGAAGIIATYVIGRLIAGPVAGLIAAALLATTSLYVQEVGVLQADMPALALGVAALAFLLASGKAGGRSRLALAVGAGLCVALAIGTKLSGAVILIPIAAYLWRFRSGRLVACVAGGFLIGSLALALPLVAAPHAAYLDLIQSHLGAGQSVNRALGTNLQMLTFKRLLPLEAMAAALVVVAVLAREYRVLPLLGWAVAAVLAIVLYQPLFPHHLVVLLPPLALIGGIGIARLITAGSVPGLAGLTLATAVALLGVIVAIGDARSEIPAGRHEAALATGLRTHTGTGDFVISDNPYAAALADRPLPGPLVDVSFQRTAAHELTVADVDRAARRYHVKFILVDSARLAGLAGFAAWVQDGYSVLAQLDGGAVLYRAR